MKCVILNRIYPPQSGTTGYFANELAEYLINNNIDVHVVTTSCEYSGIINKKTFGTVKYIKYIYTKKGLINKLVKSIYIVFKLLIEAIKYDSDIWICLSDPPLLSIFALLIAYILRQPIIYWSMDLYPDAFVSAKIIKNNNIIYKVLINILSLTKPSFLIALGENQKKYILQRYKWNVASTILPCGITKDIEFSNKPFEIVDKNTPVFGYIGNLGEAHDMDFLDIFIEALTKTKYKIVLSIYGSKSDYIKNKYEKNNSVILLKHVKINQLKFIDVHLVSLLPNWNHVCVPSKAITAISNECAVLFCGDEESDTWNYVKDCGWRVDPSLNVSNQINEFLNKFNTYDLIKRKFNAKNTYRNLLEMRSASYLMIKDEIYCLKTKHYYV
jgi:glycosyltransferase involved in cell wall biosynthesis